MKHRPRNRAILANESGPVTTSNMEVPVVVDKSEPPDLTVATTEQQPTEGQPAEELLTARFVRVRVVGQAIAHENVCYEKGQLFECSAERARTLGPFVEVLP